MWEAEDVISKAPELYTQSRVKSRYKACSVRHTVLGNKGGHENEKIFNV